MALVRLSHLSSILHVLHVSLQPFPHTLLQEGEGWGGGCSHSYCYSTSEGHRFLNISFWGPGCEFDFSLSLYSFKHPQWSKQRFVSFIPIIHQNLLFGPGFHLGLLLGTLSWHLLPHDPGLLLEVIIQNFRNLGSNSRPAEGVSGASWGPHKSQMKQGSGTWGCWWHPVDNRLHSMTPLPPRVNHFYFWHNACQLSISSGNFCFLAL